MNSRLGAIAILWAGVFAGTSFAADPAGTWRWEHQDPSTQATVKDVLKIKNTGGKVSGTYQGGGDVHKIEKAKVEGKTLSWEINIELEGNPLNIAFTVDISGDDVKGTVKLGEFGEFPWTAKRDELSPEPDPEVEQPKVADLLRELGVPDVVAKSVEEWSNLPPHVREDVESLLTGELEKLEASRKRK